VKLGDLSELPTTLSTAQAADLLGCSVDHLWALARAGESPVEPLRLGKKLVWPTAKVLRSIGLEPDLTSPSAAVVPLRRADDG